VDTVRSALCKEATVAGRSKSLLKNRLGAGSRDDDRLVGSGRRVVLTQGRAFGYEQW
jgi:hypothetical protein